MVVDLQKLQKQVASLKSKKKDKADKAWKPTSKEIVKQSRATLVLKEKPQATYVPIYFQAELNNAKKQMFFD